MALHWIAKECPLFLKDFFAQYAATKRNINDLEVLE